MLDWGGRQALGASIADIQGRRPERRSTQKFCFVSQTTDGPPSHLHIRKYSRATRILLHDLSGKQVTVAAAACGSAHHDPPPDTNVSTTLGAFVPHSLMNMPLCVPNKLLRRYVIAIALVLGFVCTLQLLHLRTESGAGSLVPSPSWGEWMWPADTAVTPKVSNPPKTDKSYAKEDSWSKETTTLPPAAAAVTIVPTSAESTSSNAPLDISVVPAEPWTEQPACFGDTAWRQVPLADLNTTITVSDHIKYDPAGPRPDQVVLLTASDGKGNNGGIENIMELATQNRKDYCKRHGYIYEFIDISKFDLGGSHAVWKKIPAIVEAFNKHPDAQWVFWLDLDAIIMTPKQDLNSLILSKEAMQKAIDAGAKHHGYEWQPEGTFQPVKIDFENTDLLIAQDHNGINAGSFLIRRSKYTQIFLDMWADPFFMQMTWEGREQEALVSIAWCSTSKIES